LQCGSILPEGARACTFCDSRLESPANSPGRGSTPGPDGGGAWRGEVSSRLASYRARRGRTAPNQDQSELPFERASQVPVPGVNIAVTEQPASAPDDFSFTIAIGRSAKRPATHEAQMFIDVSLPVEAAGQGGGMESPQRVAVIGQPDTAEHHTGQYPVAPIEERRLAGLIDAACLFFACGGFLALVGSLGGQFTVSQPHAPPYSPSLPLVYFPF